MFDKKSKISRKTEKALRELGQRIRNHRNLLGISATSTAEASNMSRVTLYRIEKGEPSVAVGAYISVAEALGLQIELTENCIKQKKRTLQAEKIPANIRIGDYKQLKKIAWQLKDNQEINAEEAIELYERNWRHLDLKSLDKSERKFIKSLLSAFGRERLLV